MERLNCWDFKNCGRQPGGPRVHEMGICPATTAKRLDGVHGGTNAGRACWVVGGTLCDGQIQESFSRKYDGCIACDFYKRVKDEESSFFQLSASLFMKLH